MRGIWFGKGTHRSLHSPESFRIEKDMSHEIFHALRCEILLLAEHSCSCFRYNARVVVLVIIGSVRVRHQQTGFTKHGKTNCYYPIMKRSEYSMSETKSFLSKLYGGSVKRMVASLYENEEISEDEVDELRKMFLESDK